MKVERLVIGAHIIEAGDLQAVPRHDPVGKDMDALLLQRSRSASASIYVS